MGCCDFRKCVWPEGVCVPTEKAMSERSLKGYRDPGNSMAVRRMS